MKKQGYSWIIILVTLKLFKALTNMRAALDPRSGTLVLFHQWKEAASPTQHLYATGIHHANDLVSREVATVDYMEQVAKSLKMNKMEIHGMTAGRWGDKGEFGTKIKFVFLDGIIPTIISPDNLADGFWTGPGNTKKFQKIRYKWPPKCYTCESESHLTAACPWLNVEGGGCKPNLYNCKDHSPGWEEPPTKAKRPFVEAVTDVVDIRPKH